VGVRNVLARNWTWLSTSTPPVWPDDRFVATEAIVLAVVVAGLVYAVARQGDGAFSTRVARAVRPLHPDKSGVPGLENSWAASPGERSGKVNYGWRTDGTSVFGSLASHASELSALECRTLGGIMNSATSGSQAAALKCDVCGAPASGHFCSSCGARLGESSSPIVEIAKEWVDFDDKVSFITNFVKVLRAPVAATLSLARDRSFRQFTYFITVGLGAYAAVAVAQVFTIRGPGLFKELLTAALLLTGFVLSTVISFFIFRRSASQPRTFAEYTKLIAVMVGFAGVFYAIASLVRFVSLRGSLIASGLMSVPLYVYYIRVQCRFWHARARRVVLVWAATSALGLAVLSPIVGAIAYFGAEPGSWLDLSKGPGDTISAAELRQLANDMNAQMPMRVDAETLLTSVQVADAELIYHYRLLALKELSAEQQSRLRSNLVNGICTRPDTTRLMTAALTLSYAYYDNQNRFAFQTSIKFGDCVLRAATADRIQSPKPR
jgi:hypothetical protein